MDGIKQTRAPGYVRVSSLEQVHGHSPLHSPPVLLGTGGEVRVGMASLEGFEPPTRRLEGDRSLL